MSSKVCKHCGCSDVEISQARGDAVCTNCGSVLEDNIIVSEVQFEQNSAGASNVIGQFVSSEGGQSHSLGGNFHHGMGKESRLVTLQNGQKRIKQVGAQLKLNHHCIDTAYNFYKMAVSRRLTRGRKSNHVVAACLYIVCRTEGTPHMLLDFADVLQANVYTLGRTYLAISKELHINIPALDPCLYIQRFAHKLEFGDKTHEVGMTALRLVSRMKRDWMAQGRRPSGLCGAALLVASRMNNFSRTIGEIIRVVKIGEHTIRKRLHEFEATPSGQLTIDEFQKIDLEEEADPPCFTEGKRKAKLQQLEDQLPQLTEEVMELQEEIDKELEDHLIKKHKRYAKDMVENKESPTPGEKAPSLSAITEAESQEVDKEVDSFLQSQLVKDILHDNEINSIRDNLRLPVLPNMSLDSSSDSLQDSGQEKDPDVEQLEQQELDSLLMPPPAAVPESGSKRQNSILQRPTLATLGIKDTVQECMKDETKVKHRDNEPLEEEGDGELDTTGLDDDELDSYILSEEAAKKKTMFWLKTNAIYLREQKEKELRRIQEEEEEKNKPDHLKKKKRPQRKKKVRIEAATAGEAIEKMLQEKKISSKINYDVLKDLNSATPKSAKKTANTDSLPLAAPLLGDGPVECNLVTLGSRKRIGDLSKDKEIKKLKVEKIEKIEKLDKPSVPVPEVIVESGPVEYTNEEDATYQDEEEDYYDEDEPVSAAALMGHAGEEEYQDDDEYY